MTITDQEPQFEETNVETPEDVYEADGATDVAEIEAELDEVDTPQETGDTAGTEAALDPKPAKVAKAPARPPVPEGYIAPVAFAKKLSEHYGYEVRPQVVYSTIRQSNSGDNPKNPLPVYSEGGRDNLLKLDEAFAWWMAKDERVAARKAAKAAQPAKTEAAPATAEPQGEVVEAE